MALVLGARGDHDAAIASAERAVDLATGLGLPFERARALLVLGDTQRRAKRRGAARQSLGEAIATFDGLGATVWSHQAAGSGRVGGRVRHEGLTPTEAQVAALVARGLTNKEVAAEFFVTVRAVEANLSRIYASSAFARERSSPTASDGASNSVVIRTIASLIAHQVRPRRPASRSVSAGGFGHEDAAAKEYWTIGGLAGPMLAVAAVLGSGAATAPERAGLRPGHRLGRLAPSATVARLTAETGGMTHAARTTSSARTLSWSCLGGP